MLRTDLQSAAIPTPVKRIALIIAGLLGGWLLLDLVATLGTDVLWFQNLGYLPVFLFRIKVQVGLWAIAFASTTFFILGNLNLAKRLQNPEIVPASGFPRGLSARKREEPTLFLSLNWQWFLPISLVLSFGMGLVVLHYAQTAFQYWQSGQGTWRIFFNSPNPSLRLPSLTGAIWKTVLALPNDPWLVGGLLGFAILGMTLPRVWLPVSALLMSVSFSLIGSGYWLRLLQFFHPIAFNSPDPILKQDISFYIFSLPIWQLLEFWLIGVSVYSLSAVLLSYLVSGNSLSQGRFLGFSRSQFCHVSGLSGVVMLAVALNYWLKRYDLLYANHRVVYGANYIDTTVRLPVYTSLSLLALAIALVLLWQTLNRRQKQRIRSRFSLSPTGLIFVLGLYWAIAALAGWGLPMLMQRLIVQPNELTLETPYIRNNIALTRSAFDLETINVEPFDPSGDLTYADLLKNDLTIRNIRLWDTRPLLQTNRQLQQIRPYYKFPGADIDRYTLKSDQEKSSPSEIHISTSLNNPLKPKIPDEKRQVLIAARELDYEAVPQQAQTWVNQHLIYTHGYGFTLSPVNTVGPGGLPDYFVKDIGSTNGTTSLTVADERIRASIPIGKPRIYYGELTNNYIMTGTKVRELDYPSGDDNVYNSYDGQGGVAIGPLWRRWLLAQALKDWQMVVTRNFTPQTRLLFRRNIQQRIQAIAPCLQYDHDPYLVVANPENSTSVDQNYLYWIVDAYTVSQYYPYSDPGSEQFNYIRNSVKVVIDAYNGSVDFYVADPSDPL
ncbi:MAG: UPF0182 family protein, partial [Leptolyngbyaceae bacterium]|nr:UPF0182 family protein [Leptolyngbyaceae bacterium]